MSNPRKKFLTCEISIELSCPIFYPKIEQTPTGFSAVRRHHATKEDVMKKAKMSSKKLRAILTPVTG